MRLYVKLPRGLQPNADRIIRDNGTPSIYLVPGAEDDEAVGRIRFVSPSNVELFPLRLILLHKHVPSFEDARTFERDLCSFYRNAAVAMGHYMDCVESEKAFDEAVTVQATPSELLHMEITLCQQRGDPERMIEKHGQVLTCAITFGSTDEKVAEIKRRIIGISDSHGGRFF